MARASYFVLARGKGTYAVMFMVNGKPFDVRGCHHTGIKEYATEKKAVAAGERYLEKMEREGYEIGKIRTVGDC